MRLVLTVLFAPVLYFLLGCAARRLVASISHAGPRVRRSRTRSQGT